jgi:putative tricarboxylic transport membrane protein
VAGDDVKPATRIPSGDRLAALVIFAVAVQYVRLAPGHQGLIVVDVVGPSAFPYIIGGLMALLATVLFLQSKPNPAGERFWIRHGRPLLLGVSLFAYIRLLEPLGFLMSTFAYLTLGHLWLGERSWFRATALGAGITVALWLLFDRLLDIKLPVGLPGWPR